MIFVTGGARSGKSTLAEKLAMELAAECGGAVTYIATACGGDEEMRARIAAHRFRRPQGWETVEAADGLPQAVEAALSQGNTVLVDCLTIYISNLLIDEGSGAIGKSAGQPEQLERDIDRLAEMSNGHGNGSKRGAGGRLIIVSNEVGMGIVPDNPLGRAFRDLAGQANQKLAAAADEVYLCVSGIPVKVK